MSPLSFLLFCILAISNASYDVVIYGGVPAGIMAAIASARQSTSARIALIHPLTHLGGMCTSGLGETDTGNASAIGGLSLEFFYRVCAHYGSSGPCYTFEPKIAELVFTEMLSEVGKNVDVFLGQTLLKLEKRGTTIQSITTVLTSEANAGVTNYSVEYNYVGGIFVDASYEGDLLPLAGVDYIVGRESSSLYNESDGGRTIVPFPSAGHQFDVQVIGTWPNGTYIRGVYRGNPGNPGDGDAKVQAYNFRMTFSKNKTNMIPFKKPLNYNSDDWELLRRYATSSQVKPGATISSFMNPSLLGRGLVDKTKTDTNNNGPVSTDVLQGGENDVPVAWEWPTASPKRRQELWEYAKEYTMGLFWTLGNDPVIPQSVRDSMNSYGLAADEYVDNDNWPYQFYVREGRRMVGEFVLTQKDKQVETKKVDTIGLAGYNVDSHNTQRFIDEKNWTRNEGDVENLGQFPVELPYRIVLPKNEQATNLLVPTAVSASHIAFGIVRLEPTWMIVGEAVGVAAVLARNGNVSVQEVNVALLQEILVANGQKIHV
jgi:FAD dependent oxidoreductase